MAGWRAGWLTGYPPLATAGPPGTGGEAESTDQRPKSEKKNRHKKSHHPTQPKPTQTRNPTSTVVLGHTTRHASHDDKSHHSASWDLRTNRRDFFLKASRSFRHITAASMLAGDSSFGSESIETTLTMIPSTPRIGRQRSSAVSCTCVVGLSGGEMCDGWVGRWGDGERRGRQEPPKQTRNSPTWSRHT